MKKNIVSIYLVVRVYFGGEQGFDFGVMAKEFFILIFFNIGFVMFFGGKLFDLIFYVQNGNFKRCGQIVVLSLVQGGRVFRFFDKSVYLLLVNSFVLVYEFDFEKYLIFRDRVLVSLIRIDIILYIDIIIEYGYIGSIDDFYIEEILKFIVISMVIRRVLYLKEFLEGFNVYGLGSII